MATRLTTLKSRLQTLPGRMVTVSADSWRSGKESSTARGYGYKWQQARTGYLAHHPLCVYCEREERVATVERCVPGLPVPVLAAFSDAVFNLGPGLACSRTTSTAARMLYAGDLVGACNQLPRWDKARVLGAMVALPGLTKRRTAERSLCLTGVP